MINMSCNFLNFNAVKHVSSFFSLSLARFLCVRSGELFCEILKGLDALSPPQSLTVTDHQYSLPTLCLQVYYKGTVTNATWGLMRAAGLHLHLGFCFFLSSCNEQGFSNAYASVVSLCILGQTKPRVSGEELLVRG